MEALHTDRVFTDQDLEEISRDDAHRYELIRGRLFVGEPSNHVHGYVASKIGWRLASYVRPLNLGRVYAAETGFRLSKDTVRAPDAAFVATGRLTLEVPRRGYFPGPPDLAVEIVSPSETFSEVEGKAVDWLDAGVRMVIVVDPERETATIYRPSREAVMLRDDDVIDGGDVVPGWRLPLRELFEDEAHSRPGVPR